MTGLKDLERQVQVPKGFTTLGNRLKHIFVSKIQERTTKQSWLRFTEGIRKRYDSHGIKSILLKKRAEAEKPKPENPPYSKYLQPSESEERISPELNLQKSGPVTEMERSGHFTIDSRLKDFLARILNIRIPSVKIYANRVSDALVKKFDADALTYKDKILFRAGRYDPRGKRGIALLGHELTHASRSRIANKNVPRHLMTNLHQDEEQEALDNEKRMLRYLSSTEAYRENRKPSNPALELPNAQVRTQIGMALKLPMSNKGYTEPPNFGSTDNRLAHLQTALSSRDLTLPPETNTNSNTATELSEGQLRLIKGEVYRDIMDRIRTESERGG